MFHLKKIKIHENEYSMVRPGSSITSKFIEQFNWEKPEERTPIYSLDDVVVGKQIIAHTFVDFIRTSKITEIIEKTENKIVFKTETSTYELTYNADI